MPYRIVSVPTNNDSFFYALAVQFRERRYRQPTPDSWFEEDIVSDPGWRPPYHGHIHLIARQLRRRVANWAAEEILDNTLEEISNAWIQVVGQRYRLERLLEVLEESHEPILFTDALTETCVLTAFPEPLQLQWATATGVDRKRTLLAFFLYWYSLTQDDIDRDPQFRALAKAFGIAEPKSIPGTFDVTHNNYNIECGFAPWAVTQLQEEEIYLKPVVESESNLAESASSLSDLIGIRVPDPDYMFLYLHEDPSQSWHAVMWQPHTPPLGELEFGSEGGISGNSESRNINGLARHDRNTIRSPFLFSMCVWNLNHLRKNPKNKKGGKEITPSKRHSSRKAKPTPLVVGGPEGFLGTSLSDPELRAVEKVKATQSLIDLNFDWLDVIALNEVNEGVDRLDKLTSCDVYRGPHLMAIGETGKVGQHEYYPLLILNRDRAFTIAHKGFTAVFTSGAVRDVANQEEIQWSKHDKVLKKSKPIDDQVLVKKSKTEENKLSKGNDIEAFRPIVVHRLLIDEGEQGECWVNVGIIHTTPSGSEFERYYVYHQVEQFFQLAGSGTIDKADVPNHWLVAGDYYLFGESRVIADGKLKKGGLNVEDAFEALIKNEDPTALENLEELMKATIHDLELFAADGKSLPLKAKELDGVLEKWENLIGLRKSDLNAVQWRRSQLAKVKEKMEETKETAESWLKWIRKQGDKKALAKFKAIWETQGQMDSLLKVDFHTRVLLQECAALIKTLDKTYEQVLRQEPEEEVLGQEKAEERVTIRVDYDEGDEEDDDYASPEKYFERNREETFLRSKRLRNLLMSTFAAQIEDKFNVMHTIWGTNFHESGVVNVANRDKPQIEYTGFRIADFIVSSKSWKTGRIGLFSGEESGVIHVDDECITTTRHWRILSDHFPVGGRFSLGFQDPRVEQVFIEDLEGQKRQARVILYCLDACDLILDTFAPEDQFQQKLVDCWGSRNYGKAMQLILTRLVLWIKTTKILDERWEDIVLAIGNLEITDDPDHVAATLRTMTAQLAKEGTKSKVGGIWEMPSTIGNSNTDK